MRFFSRLSDRDADTILAGNVPADGGDELQELASFFRDARIALAEPPATAVAAAHLAAIAEVARHAAGQASETAAPFRPRQRRLRNPLALPARLAAATAGIALVAAFGGAAYAGVLPDPVQGKVADIANTIGLSLPGNANDVNQGDVGNQDQGSQGNTDQGSTGNQDQGPQGNTDNGPQGNTDQGSQSDTNDGPQGNTDNGPQENTDNGVQANTDKGAESNLDQGAQGNADDGTQGDKSGGGDSSGSPGDSGDNG
jgi:hypothetical protein